MTPSLFSPVCGTNGNLLTLHEKYKMPMLVPLKLANRYHTCESHGSKSLSIIEGNENGDKATKCANSSNNPLGSHIPGVLIPRYKKNDKLITHDTLDLWKNK